MVCLACGGPAVDRLCPRCVLTLAPGAERRVGSVTVRPAFVHEGAARALVLRLKYAGLAAAAGPLAAAMAPLVPADATALVPVPRVIARRWSYGVDPAVELARAVARLRSIPVLSALRPPVWVRHRAGRAGRRRGTPGFRPVAPVPPGAVLVDDVVTSGATLAAAGAATGLGRAVTATAGLRP
jgi:predicted amidophosphoribosyltransferase